MSSKKTIYDADDIDFTEFANSLASGDLKITISSSKGTTEFVDDAAEFIGNTIELGLLAKEAF